MRSLQTTFLIVALLSAAVRVYADDLAKHNIVIQTTAFVLSKTQASEFNSGHNLESEAEKGFKDLQLLVEQKKAEIASNASVTAKSGCRADNNTGVTKLEVEPVLSPAGDKVDVVLLFSYGNVIKINTSYLVKNGDLKFLGAFDAEEATKSLTYMVFVQTNSPK